MSGDRPNVYSMMADPVLERAVADLERACSQPAMQSAPAAIRVGYLDALDQARAELDRRRT